jgi:ABC-2 type transport system permease protein
MVSGTENKVKVKTTNHRSMKSQNLIRLFLLLLILVMVNVISSFVFTRFDLTSEKRFTLSPATRELVGSLDDIVYVQVYLDGDFPPSFKRLQSATREMLDELRAYSNGNIEYEFINPSSHPEAAERNKVYQQLASKGIQPTNLQAKSNDGTSQQIIFPGAFITHKGQTAPLMLLQDQAGMSPEEMLNNSIQGLEYGFSNTIKKLAAGSPSIITVLEGNGMAPAINLADIMRDLQMFYAVERKKIDGNLKSIKGVKAVIVPAPDSTFSEKDKFILDQYVMNGGRVLWLIDGSKATMDSLATNSETIALANDVNLGDMLFRYGARINYDVVMDLQAAPIPVVTGMVGNRPQQSLLPWYYFPVVIPESKHPVVNNLNAIRFEFVSSIDTVGSKEIIKTPLLTTSQYSKVSITPARIDLDVMRKEPDVSSYNSPNRMVAVLLEGEFTSSFKNRIPAQIANDPEIGFRDKSKPTRMIVVSDGDIIKNRYRGSNQAIIPLGEDRYTGQVFGNKNFLLNCIDYLCDDSGMMSVRSKELKLRLLDRARVGEEKLKWQIINTAGPVVVVLLFGIFKFYRRRVRYAR